MTNRDEVCGTCLEGCQHCGEFYNIKDIHTCQEKLDELQKRVQKVADRLAEDSKLSFEQLHTPVTF